MIKHVFTFCSRTTLLVLEIMGGVLLLGVAVVGVLLWKFSEGPVDITFAAQRVREALIIEGSGNNIKFDGIVAEWPDFNGPVSVGLSGVVITQNNHDVLSVPQLGIRIAKLPLLVGLIKPEAVIVTQPTLRLVRHKDGSLHLFLSKDESVAVSSATSPSIGLKELGESFFKGGNLPDYSALEPLSQLETVIVKDANVSVENELANKKWEIPHLNFELYRHQNSFDINFSYTDKTGLESSLSLGLARDEGSSEGGAETRLTGDLQHLNIATWAQLFLPSEYLKNEVLILDGHIDGTLDAQWQLQNLIANLGSDKGALTIKGLNDALLTFEDLEAHVRFDKSQKLLMLSDTHLTMNGREIALHGERKLGDTSAVYPLSIRIPELSFDELRQLWPESARDTLLADWLTLRLDKGVVHNFQMTLPVDFTNPDLVDATQIDASLDFEKLNVDYRAPLMPAANTKGHASLKDDTLTIDVVSGRVADLDIKQGKVTLTHLAHPTIIGEVVIDASLHGPLGTYIDYIGREPINLSSKIGFKPQEVRGSADAHAIVRFPGLKDLPLDAVKVTVDGRVHDAFLPKVAKGLDLTGGPYDLKVDDSQFSFSGKGKLGSAAIDVQYAAYLDLKTAPYVSTVKATMIADKSLRAAFGVDVEQFVVGAFPVDIDYREGKDKKEDIIFKADLTPAVFKISPLGYKKVAGIKGNATGHVVVKNGVVLKVSDLDIRIDKDGGLKGALDFGQVGKINDVISGKFPNVTLGGHNDFSLNFSRPQPQSYKIGIEGKEFDARRYTGRLPEVEANEAGATSPAVDVQLQVSRLKTGDLPDQMLSNAKVNVSVNSQDDITYLELTGRIPHGDFLLSLKPDKDGPLRLIMKSDNAGEALRVMDVYKDMVGGKLEIGGLQKGKAINDIQGTMRITDFSIVRAPVLAKLINLFSLSGMSELLQNKGISFEKMKSDFSWVKEGHKRKIYMRDGRMTGSSLGLTFGGVIHQSEGRMDISGTFVPMSQINSFVNKIPLIGNLLTGGKNGGIIAATYAVKGSSNDAAVMINPLSVLTPGFLRTLFFNGNSGFLGDEQADSPIQKPKGYNN